MFQSERFFRESWPAISQAGESPADAAPAVQWVVGRAGLKGGARLLLDRFWRALSPGGVFVLDTRNRDQCVRSMPREERQRFEHWTLRIENSFDPITSRWLARWWRLAAGADDQPGDLIGESEIRLYSAHELRAMLRPERWSRVDLYGALDGTPFSLDTPRLVLVARK